MPKPPTASKARRKISNEERWSRSWLDTQGFKEWLRNSVISAVAAAVTFFGQQELYNTEEAMKDLWLSVGMFVAMFVLLPVFELIWNYVRAPRRILEDENERLETAKGILEASLAERQQGITPAQWIELSDRFKATTGIADLMHADWNRMSNGKEVWNIRGNGHRGECEALCRLAGTMLLKSPNVLSGLSEKVRSQDNPLIRWLDFLVESGIGRLEGMSHGVETDSEGNQIGMLCLHASLNHLGPVSSRACIECAAKES